MFISLITVRVRGRRKRINSSWERGVRFVLARKGGRRVRWGGGWSWLGRAGFESTIGGRRGGRSVIGVGRRGNRDSWVGYWRYLNSTPPPDGIGVVILGERRRECVSFAIASYLKALERRMGAPPPEQSCSQMYDYLSYTITYLP